MYTGCCITAIHFPLPLLTAIILGLCYLTLSIFTEALKSVQRVATLFAVLPWAQQEMGWGLEGGDVVRGVDVYYWELICLVALCTM